MSGYRSLYDRFQSTVSRHGHQIAFVEQSGLGISYLELDHFSKMVGAFLIRSRLKAGDRVGIYMRKSIDSIAAIMGTLHCGGIYVPLDGSAPVPRAALIFSDCDAEVIFTETSLRAELEAACEKLNYRPQFLDLSFDSASLPLRALLEEMQIVPSQTPVPHSIKDPAYILYTSGSTGNPKGVVLTHENGDSFIDWCASEFPLTSRERFSMHAPFHFDLSVFDIHATIRVGGTGIIIPESVGKNPVELVRYIKSTGITIWYSVPSVLMLMIRFGGLAKTDLDKLKLVLFAGEEFPISQLRLLAEYLPRSTFYNLYGPTETNVCTFFKIPNPIPKEQTVPFPIGKTCHSFFGKLNQDLPDRELAENEGELHVSGAGVMRGYWNRQEENNSAFITDTDGKRWYRTRDLVRETQPGCFTYVGRMDRMIKKRGFRIEPGEIEAVLHTHPEVTSAALLSRREASGDAELYAFVAGRPEAKLSVIALKEFCAKALPQYMVPDRFVLLEQMPLTSTAKIDFQRLKELLR